MIRHGYGTKTTAEDERHTRATAANNIPERARSKITQASFNNDAKKLWNKAPLNIKNSISFQMAKKNIKKHL